jgi:histidinol-phosphate aminotransferase
VSISSLRVSWVMRACSSASVSASRSRLARSLATLRTWKAAQLRLCAALDWAVVPGSQANYFTARLPLAVADVAPALQALRAQGIKLRDCASFGLPGHVRLGVLGPGAQRALRAAWLLLNQ